MHYRNGREAKQGDLVVTRGWTGVYAGVVVKTTEGCDTCNLTVQPVNSPITVSAKDCLHIDDAMPEIKATVPPSAPGA